MIETRLIPAIEPGAYETARAIITSGGLVCFPTDTVYGLAAGIHSEEGIRRLYTAKGRKSSKAIPVLAGSLEQARSVTSHWPPEASRLGKKFWPGPLTLVLPGAEDLPSELSPDGTVGVRLPDHPAALHLLEVCGPLAVTSANLSGQKEALSVAEALRQLGGRVELILDGGASPGGVPSTVVRLAEDGMFLLRPGPISFQDILRAAEGG